MISAFTESSSIVKVKLKVKPDKHSTLNVAPLDRHRHGIIYNNPLAVLDIQFYQHYCTGVELAPLKRHAVSRRTEV